MICIQPITFAKSALALVSSAVPWSTGPLGGSPSVRGAVGVGCFVPASAAAPEAGGTLGGIAIPAPSDDGGPWAQRLTGGALCARSWAGALVSQ